MKTKTPRSVRGKILTIEETTLPELAEKEGWSLWNLKAVFRRYIATGKRPRSNSEAERILCRLEELVGERLAEEEGD